jgi:hypothetical protein
MGRKYTSVGWPVAGCPQINNSNPANGYRANRRTGERVNPIDGIFLALNIQHAFKN